MTTKAQQQERKVAIEQLSKILKPGQTVYTILRHVSKSGMYRNISVVIAEHGEISWLVAKALGENLSNTSAGVKVVDDGLGAGFRLVSILSFYVFPGLGEFKQRWL